MFHVKHEALLDSFPAAVAGLESYARWLETAGIDRGLIGPREADRIWDRHIANCAVVQELIKPETSVIDIGSGAGLPGLVLAIVRPDIQMTLVEPLLRRCEFLNEVVADLGLADRVDVRRGRADEMKGLTASVVTSRAVAPMTKLISWSMPLVKNGGEILAMKGSSAQREIDEAAKVLKNRSAEIVQCGQGIVDPLTTVVRVAI